MVLYPLRPEKLAMTAVYCARKSKNAALKSLIRPWAAADDVGGEGWGHGEAQPAQIRRIEVSRGRHQTEYCTTTQEHHVGLKIKIEAGNEEAIQKAIDAVEGRAVRRTVSAYDVIDEAERVERWLTALGVPKSRRPSTEIVVSGAVRLPGSYGSADATYVSINRSGDAWRLTKVERTWNAPTRTRAAFPFTAHELGSWAVQANFLATFG